VGGNSLALELIILDLRHSKRSRSWQRRVGLDGREIHIRVQFSNLHMQAYIVARLGSERPVRIRR
jgi:hypothetical protein